MQGQLLGGRYRLVRQLGEGGMGQVWQARDETLDRSVAVKIVSLLAGGGSRGDEARARFLREARITARLQHPHIVTIHDLGETGTGNDRVPFLVMELVRGEGLDAMLREGAVPLTEAAVWGAQICDALAHAHDAGIMHRDIKPSNILITPSGAAKVLDFGVARAADPCATGDRLTQTGFIVGTPPYMAPEQARGFPEPRSDLYAVGCLLFELITGRLPFHAPDTVGYLTAHLTQEPPKPSSVSADIPPAWDALVLALLHKDPAQRYRSAADLAQALRQLHRVEGLESRTEQRTLPLARSAAVPILPASSSSGASEAALAPGTAPATARRGPDSPPAIDERPAPQPPHETTATAVTVLALLCALTAPAVPIAAQQAVNSGLMTIYELTAHVTLTGLEAVMLAAGALMLRLRNTTGHRLIAAGGTGLALQALTVGFDYEGMGLALRGVLPVIAVMAVVTVFQAGHRGQWERFGLAAAVFVQISLSANVWNFDLQGETASVTAQVWFLRLFALMLPLFAAALTPRSGRMIRAAGYVCAALNAAAFVLGAALGARATHVRSTPEYLTALFVSIAVYCYRDVRTRWIRSADR
ncbi:serine/threonine-protein kinase [Streptomyces sp. NPDC058731]|uniref:serine/threonine-protein kinase n=1 Tax=Streptomyces sp. NPDC058731 TaxID=3346613 RepID=UPI00368DBB3B